MSVMYRAKHRTETLRQRLTSILVGAAGYVAFAGLLLFIIAATAVALAMYWLIGEAWWSVGPLYGILWFGSVALIVPVALLGRWRKL